MSFGGWAWPFGGEQSKGLPVAKVTVNYADGGAEEFTFKNGVEFVDYPNANEEVPGSAMAGSGVRGGE